MITFTRREYYTFADRPDQTGVRYNSPTLIRLVQAGLIRAIGEESALPPYDENDRFTSEVDSLEELVEAVRVWWAMKQSTPL